MHITNSYVFSVHTDLLILGFEQDTYQVSEANNSVVVCVNITDSIERSVVINLQTTDGTAQGQGKPLNIMIVRRNIPISMSYSGSSLKIFCVLYLCCYLITYGTGVFYSTW